MRERTAIMANPALIGAMVDASPDLFFFKDAAFVYRYANRAFCELFGLPVEAVVGRTDYDLFPPANADRHRRADQAVLASGESGTFEYEVVQGGRPVWLQVLKTPVRDASGSVAGFFCAARNITARKQSEAASMQVRHELERGVAERDGDLRRINQALRRQIEQRRKIEAALEESLRTVNLIFDNSPLGIIFVTGRVVRQANPRMHELFAFPQGTLGGRPTSVFYPDEAAFEAFGRISYEMLGRGERVDTVRVMRRADGTDFLCRVIGQVLYPDRPQEGSIWLMEDVTDRKMAEEAMLAAERLKREFMDNMSHEIRTPLNGILGMAQLLGLTELSDEQRVLVGTLHDSARALLSLLESILDFARLDAGERETARMPFSLGNILQGAANSFGSLAMQKGLSLEWRVDPDVPDLVVGDGAGLRQVLAALLSNAIKFTPEGRVEVEVSRSDACRPSAAFVNGKIPLCLSFSVRDTGIGLRPEEIDTIFEPFRQVDGSMTRRFGGAGLGLAIARKMAAAMGGELSVTSTPGEGSVFRFVAPFDLPAQPAGTAA